MCVCGVNHLNSEPTTAGRPLTRPQEDVAVDFAAVGFDQRSTGSLRQLRACVVCARCVELIFAAASAVVSLRAASICAFSRLGVSSSAGCLTEERQRDQPDGNQAGERIIGQSAWAESGTCQGMTSGQSGDQLAAETSVFVHFQAQASARRSRFQTPGPGRSNRRSAAPASLTQPFEGADRLGQRYLVPLDAGLRVPNDQYAAVVARDSRPNPLPVARRRATSGRRPRARQRCSTAARVPAVQIPHGSRCRRPTRGHLLPSGP